MIYFEQIEAGKVRLAVESVNLHEIIHSSLLVTSPLFQQKSNVKLQTNIEENLPAFFSGDSTKIKQIMINLLANAIKFTNSGIITLQVKLTSNRSILRKMTAANTYVKSWANAKRYIKFTVKDSGIGIEAKNFEKIFSAFEQVR